MAKIYLDVTFFIQVGIFLFLLLVLSRLFFKPLLEMYDRREKLISDPAASAQRLARDAEEKKNDYRARLGAGIAQAADLKAAAAREAGATEKEILQGARAENETFLAGARGELAAAKDRALDDLRGQAEAFSTQLVQTILGRPNR